MKTLIAVLATGLFCIATASPIFVITRNDNTGVYSNRIRSVYEKPLFTAGSGILLQVLEEAGSKFLRIN